MASIQSEAWCFHIDSPNVPKKSLKISRTNPGFQDQPLYYALGLQPLASNCKRLQSSLESLAFILAPESRNTCLELSSPTPAAVRSPLSNKPLLGLLALGLLIHLGFGWLLTLSVDEAHYMLYADKLDWSYFDHPPLVGWIQWPLVALRAPDWVIRLIPQALWLASCLLARHIARSLHAFVPGWSPAHREAAGLWAVGLVLLAPVMHVLAVGLLPDTLLMTLTLALMSVTLRLTAPDPAPHSRQWASWITLGLLLGLAGLSKYTAILPAAAIVVCLVGRHGVGLFGRAGPWLAIVIGTVLVVPVFYWNARHDWISFAYQLNHGTGGAWQLRRLAAFVGIQLVAYGPLLVLGSVLAIRQIVQQRVWQIAGLLLFFLIPFGVTAWLSVGGGSLPHWTAPAWLAITPFAANAIAARWADGKHALILALARTQAVICLLAFIGLFFVGIPGISQEDDLGKKNPLADLWGWDRAGVQARALARTHGIASLAVKNWTLASRMTWYARPLPVFVLDDRFDQFDLWFGQIPPGSDSLFVNWSQMRFDLPVKAGEFQTCTELEHMDILRFGRRVSDFTFYHCRNWGAGNPRTTPGQQP